MEITLKMMKKLDDLLKEAEEYTECATMHADDSELKAAYMDLARCHYEGYEKLSRCAERTAERKMRSDGQNGHAIQKMVAWHKNEYEDRAQRIKKRMEQAR